MFVLPENQKQQLNPLFSRDLPSRVILWAYLQSRVPGITYVDDPSNPTFCVVVLEFHHISFVGWTTDPFDLAGAITEVLVEEQYLDIVWEESFPFPKPALKFSDSFKRLEFFQLNEKVFQETKRSAIGKGIPSPVDSSNFDWCESKSEHLLAFEIKENFLRNSFGILLTEEGKYVCDASAIFIGDGENSRYGDIQIVTRKEYRRQGYGLKVAGLLIEEMRARGISPVWSCHKDNVASEGIAKRLGFVEGREFEILCIDARPPFLKYWEKIMDQWGVTYESKDAAVAFLRSEYQLPRQVAHWLVMAYINVKSRA